VSALIPSPSKSSHQIFEIFSHFAHNNTANKWRKHKKIIGSVFEKISLQNCKISNFAYSLAGTFIKQFSTANLNNFQPINLLKFTHLLTMTPQDIW